MSLSVTTESVVFLHWKKFNLIVKIVRDWKKKYCSLNCILKSNKTNVQETMNNNVEENEATCWQWNTFYHHYYLFLAIERSLHNSNYCLWGLIWRKTEITEIGIGWFEYFNRLFTREKKCLTIISLIHANFTCFTDVREVAPHFFRMTSNLCQYFATNLQLFANLLKKVAKFWYQFGVVRIKGGRAAWSWPPCLKVFTAPKVGSCTF